MSRLKEIDEKIIKLKKLKVDVEAREAKELYQKLKRTIGDLFTPALAFTMMEEIWNAATEEQKERWLKKASSFRVASSSKKASKNQQKTDPASQ